MKRLVIVLICAVTFGVVAQNRNYLMYTDGNISKLKSQIKTDNAVKSSWQNELSKAKKILKSEKKSAADCQTLGLVYRMTGDDKYANAIKAILLDVITEDTWESEGLLNRTPAWNGGLRTSHTTFFSAIGFDSIYEYLTEEERQKIAEGIVKLGIQPTLGDWLFPDTNFHTFDTMGHNWWSACVYIAGFGAIAVRNEIPEAEQWLEDIDQSVTEWINYSGSVLQNKPPTFDKDGGFYESVNYATYGISQYLLFRYAFTQALPNKKQVELPILDKIGDFFIQTAYYIDNDTPLSVNFGDSFVRKTGNACVTLLWHLGYTKDAYAWYIKHASKGTDKEGLQLNTPNGLALYPDLPKLDSSFQPNLATSQLYEDMGWATLRNSWKNNATMLAVKSGFTWNHTHADAGSYILFHNGKNLIIDSGNSSYGNPLYTQYYCQSEAHNVVLFNGEGQNRKDPYFGVTNPGSLHNLIEGKDFKYVLANATGPYSQILTRNYRSFIWVGDVILVIDDLLAHEPGKFEWLLHYNGQSKRRGEELSIKDGNAEVVVRSLFPETFPSGGLPHDFPEQMRLEEKLGYEDHHPENRQAYWSISHFEHKARTKFVSAIILKSDENKNNLPVIERFEGKDFISVSITQHGETTEVYFNLLADGRLKHRNSVINMNGWETDAYLTVLKFKSDDDKTNIKNVKDVFMGHGSYLRRNGQVLAHALSKYTTLVEGFNTTPEVTFQGQPNVKFSLFSPEKTATLKINNKAREGKYQASEKLLQVMLSE